MSDGGCGLWSAVFGYGRLLSGCSDIGKCNEQIVRRLVMVASRWHWVAGCGAVFSGTGMQLQFARRLVMVP